MSIHKTLSRFLNCAWHNDSQVSLKTKKTRKCFFTFYSQGIDLFVLIHFAPFIWNFFKLSIFSKFVTQLKFYKMIYSILLNSHAQFLFLYRVSVNLSSVPNVDVGPVPGHHQKLVRARFIMQMRGIIKRAFPGGP